MQTKIQANPTNRTEFLDMLFLASSLRAQGYGVTVVANPEVLVLTTNAGAQVVSEATKALSS